jgi:lipoyl-dependent peroxiredoxin
MWRIAARRTLECEAGKADATRWTRGRNHMPISKASAHWEGSLKDGRGSMKPANAAEAPFGLASRFEGQKGSNPEELIGAALSGCFSMALSASLGKAGLTPKSIDTEAQVHLERDGEGFKISKIELTTRAAIEGIDAAKFESIAQETKKGCPVSKALAGTTITLSAKLA